MTTSVRLESELAELIASGVEEVAASTLAARLRR